MKYRDLNLVSWDEDSYLVISCDSAGGIGMKKGDIIKAEPRILGFHTAQVVLMEMLSIGVYPFFLSNTLSVEMNPSGQEILAGIKDALKILGLEEKVEITGSTEENIKVTASGMGLTLMGRISKKEFRFPETRNNDLAVVIGRPACGQGVLDGNESEHFNLKVLKKIIGKKYIHELIPGGSGGIVHEIAELERRSNLIFKKAADENLDLHASAGPGTSALCTLHRDHLKQLERDIEMPVVLIGEFVEGEDCEDLWEKSL